MDGEVIGNWFRASVLAHDGLSIKGSSIFVCIIIISIRIYYSKVHCGRIRAEEKCVWF